jgi:hypothetical protein
MLVACECLKFQSESLRPFYSVRVGFTCAKNDEVLRHRYNSEQHNVIMTIDSFDMTITMCNTSCYELSNHFH